MKNKRLSRLVPETPGGGLTGLGRGALRVTNLAGQHPGKETPVPRAKSQQPALPAPADPTPTVSVQFTLPHFLPLSPSLHSHYVSAILSRTLIAQEPELLHKDDYKMTPWGFFF